MTNPSPTQPAPQRLLSLDTLRGFDMLFIMGFAPLVAAICTLWPGDFSGWLATQTHHPAWNGFTHHDTIFPLFLFIAGISFPFSLAKQREKGMSDSRILGRVVRRCLTLIALGVIYNGFFQFNLEWVRIPSVLGRIGLAWMLAAMLYMYCGLRMRIVLSAVILIGYNLLIQFVAAPDAAGAVPLTEAGNIVGYVDRCIMPTHLLGGRGFDPEGLLSTLPAIVTALLGIFTGEFIRRGEASGIRKTLWMAAGTAVLLAAGLGWGSLMPVNKSLWNGPFVCLTGAYSLGMFALFYYLIDVRQWRRWTYFFKVIGLNSITIYMAQAMIDFGFTSNYFLGGVASKLPPETGAVVLCAGYVAICWLFLWFLDRRKIYLKI